MIVFRDGSEDVDPYRATSWTGSERLRRPQGGCLPPTRPPRKVARFFVPAGTWARVTPLARIAWRPYRTRMDLKFERFETYRDKHYEFRQEGWLLRVHRSDVVHREDAYSEGKGGAQHSGRV